MGVVRSFWSGTGDEFRPLNRYEVGRTGTETTTLFLLTMIIDMTMFMFTFMAKTLLPSRILTLPRPTETSPRRNKSNLPQSKRTHSECKREVTGTIGKSLVHHRFASSVYLYGGTSATEKARTTIADLDKNRNPEQTRKKSMRRRKYLLRLLSCKRGTRIVRILRDEESVHWVKRIKNEA